MNLLVFTRRCLRLLHLHFFLHFVCLICRKIIGRLGLIVVPILAYSHVFPSTNIPHTTMHLYRITHQLFTSHDHTYTLLCTISFLETKISILGCVSRSTIATRHFDSIIHHQASLLRHLTTTKKVDKPEPCSQTRLIWMGT